MKEIILNFIETYNVLTIGGVIGGIGLLYAIIKLVYKKLGLQVINVASSIVSFIQNTLKSLNVTNNKLDTFFDLILQALLYASAISNEESTIEDKIEISINFIKNVITELKDNGADIEINENEYETIKIVLKVCFGFIDTFGLNNTINVKYSKKLSIKVNK